MSKITVVFDVNPDGEEMSDYDNDIFLSYLRRIGQLTDGRVKYVEGTAPAAPLTAPVEQAMIHTVADVRSVLAPKAAKK